MEGKIVTPNGNPPLFVGAKLFRNLDFQFDKSLMKESSIRKIRTDIILREVTGGYALEFIDESGVNVKQSFDWEHSDAKTPQYDNIRHQLSKLGTTPFRAGSIVLMLSGNRFIPSSVLSDWRRTLVNLSLNAHKISYQRDYRRQSNDMNRCDGLLPLHFDYSANVSNAVARDFYYKDCGVRKVDDAFEIHEPPGSVLMTCKYCLRHALGACLKDGTRKLAEPLMLRIANGEKFRLGFDCKNCQMRVYATDGHFQ